jgi:hypothetical protein
VKSIQLSQKIAYDDAFNQLDIFGQWLFMRMLPFANNGELPSSINELKLLCIPAQKEIPNTTIANRLDNMVGLGLLLKVGKNYKFRSWDKHQKRRMPRKLNVKPYKERVEEYFRNIDPAFLNTLKEAYPNVDIKAELGLSKQWLVSNTNRAKRDFNRFVNNWMKNAMRDYQKGETKKVKKEPFERKFKKTTTGLYKAFCSKCGNSEYPSNVWQLREGSTCHRVDYVPTKEESEKYVNEKNKNIRTGQKVQ